MNECGRPAKMMAKSDNREFWIEMEQTQNEASALTRSNNIFFFASSNNNNNNNKNEIQGIMM